MCKSKVKCFRRTEAKIRIFAQLHDYTTYGDACFTINNSLTLQAQCFVVLWWRRQDFLLQKASPASFLCNSSQQHQDLVAVGLAYC